MHIKIQEMEVMFKALPRDLQWEVLIEFVGTHVVRGGKLMRKIVLKKVIGETFRQLSGNKVLRMPVAELVRKRQELPELFSVPRELLSKEEQEASRPKYLRLYSNDKMVRFFRDQYTDETVYLHLKKIDFIMLYEMQYPADSVEVVLPPYIKTKYPSYPYTDKKRKIAL
jgi:hypothetical protein